MACRGSVAALICLLRSSQAQLERDRSLLECYAARACVGRRHTRQLTADGNIDVLLSGILLRNGQTMAGRLRTPR